MTAVRILNPVVLSEFCSIRASPSAVGRNMPCGRQLNRIKRDLFGPANPVETTKLFNEELEKHQEKAMKKWGFDFRTGTPAHTNAHQFIWERVSFQESSIVPEMYTLTRAAHVRPECMEPTNNDILMDERSMRENYLNTSSCASTDDSCDDESQDESCANSPSSSTASSASTVTFKVPAVAGHSSTETTLTVRCGRTLRKRQPKITEYMKERKRLAQTPKKASPAKRMRTSSGSSSQQQWRCQSQHAGAKYNFTFFTTQQPAASSTLNCKSKAAVAISSST